MEDKQLKVNRIKQKKWELNIRALMYMSVHAHIVCTSTHPQTQIICIRKKLLRQLRNDNQTFIFILVVGFFKAFYSCATFFRHRNFPILLSYSGNPDIDTLILQYLAWILSNSEIDELTWYQNEAKEGRQSRGMLHFIYFAQMFCNSNDVYVFAS